MFTRRTFDVLLDVNRLGDTFFFFGRRQSSVNRITGKWRSRGNDHRTTDNNVYRLSMFGGRMRSSSKRKQKRDDNG